MGGASKANRRPLNRRAKIEGFESAQLGGRENWVVLNSKAITFKYQLLPCEPPNVSYFPNGAEDFCLRSVLLAPPLELNVPSLEHTLPV